MNDKIDLCDYLSSVLTSLRTVYDAGLLTAILVELYGVVLDTISSDDGVKLSLLHLKYKEFDQGFQRSKKYSTKQIQGFINVIESELYLLKKQSNNSFCQTHFQFEKLKPSIS